MFPQNRPPVSRLRYYATIYTRWTRLLSDIRNLQKTSLLNAWFVFKITEPQWESAGWNCLSFNVLYACVSGDSFVEKKKRSSTCCFTQHGMLLDFTLTPCVFFVLWRSGRLLSEGVQWGKAHLKQRPTLPSVFVYESHVLGGHHHKHGASF